MSPKNGDRAKAGERRRRSESRSSSREQTHRKRRERSPSRDRRSRSRSPPPTGGSKRLHIGNIDESIRRRDIEDTFAKYGRLADIWLASYPPYYAFVVYERAEDASDALSDMRSGFIKIILPVQDCRVRTTIALPRQNLRRAPLPTRRSYRRSPSPSMSPPARKRKNSRSRSASPRRERVSKEKDKKEKKEKDCKKKREKKSKKHHRSGSESS